MSFRNTTLVSAALCALSITTAAQTTPLGPPATTERPVQAKAPVALTGGIARASNLIGRSVVDSSDKVVGEVKDILAFNTGRLVVLIERDSDDMLVAAPMSALKARLVAKSDKSDKADKLDKADTADKSDRSKADTKGDGIAVSDTAKVDRFVFDSTTTLASAPVVADKNRIDQAWWNAFGEHYAIKSAKKADTTQQDAVCLATLIGQDVKSPAGDVIGNVKDVAVELADGTLAYVVVSTGGVMGAGSALHGVRIDALRQDADRKFVTLQSDKATLERMTGINIDRLPARANLEVGAAMPADSDREVTAGSTPR
jgi:sporulation protein YlmC with PRC-barrel domain